ncbi:hypothetical protein H0H87_001869, partial [Tephrocybe sp. NHM501043]
PSACKASSPTPSTTAPSPTNKSPSKGVTLPKPSKSSGSGSGATSGRNTPAPTPCLPNLLPTWADTFHTLPRSLSSSSATFSEGFRFSRVVRRLVSGVLSPTVEEHNHNCDLDHDRVLHRRAKRYAMFRRTYAPPSLSFPFTSLTPSTLTPASAKSWLGTGMSNKEKDILRGCMGEAVWSLVSRWYPPQSSSGSGAGAGRRTR